MEKQEKLLQAMIQYDGGDPLRIQHFMKVWGFARLIGRLEGLDEETQEILETAAIVHDIGIREAERKYGRADGKLQEQEGPPLANKMLAQLGFPEKLVERVAWLVGRHHTYTDVEGLDYRILLEADFLVNLYEENAPETAVKAALEQIFRTQAGRTLCRTMFGL